MIFLGCDPGLSGAVAVYRTDRPASEQLVVHDMPTLRVKPGSEKRTIDAIELARIIDDICKEDVRHVAIELAGTRPQEGRASAHKNGTNFGVLLGVVSAQFVPIEIVPPNVWKARMTCPRAKDGARARASQLLPKHAALWSRVKDDGRAEAALLALYAEQSFRRRLEVAA